ncbi:MAG: DivIVA domain-containing protein [Actinomycetia bacterium]|nr:DivIVA domain-containing protein [Actinomycetes bacterium]
MKITALDIHQKEFAHGMRGYREDEVDAFLDQLAVEVDAAGKRIKELEDKLTDLESRGVNFEAERNTINNTLLTAQKAADEMLAKAQSECADTLAAAQRQYEAQLEDARQQSERIIADAEQKRHQLIGNFARLQGEEEKFRKKYLAQLDDFMMEVGQIEAEARSAIQEIPVPKELEKELRMAKQSRRAKAAPAPEPSAVVPAPAVAPELSAAPPALADEDLATPVPVVAPASESEDPMAAALAESDFFAESNAPAPVAEPTLQQVPVAASPAPQAAVQAPVQDPVSPSVDQWGDLDDDLDIEEID